MGTEVWIPWRPQPSRVRGFEFVRSWWEQIGFTVCTIDVTGDPFNLAACRNRAVELAQSRVVIVADADTLPELSSLDEAITLAADGHGTVLPYTAYRSLQARGSTQALTGRPLRDCHHITIPGACSGIFVTTKPGWAKHHGQDERFAGWGCEDAAWDITHTTLIGPPKRVEGVVYALTHDSQDKDGEPTRANYGRIHLYEQARGDRDRIEALARGLE